MKIYSTYSVKIKHYNKIFKDTAKLYRQAVDFLINVGLNEWADIKFNLGTEWKEASKKQYKSYEDEITKCDFYANNNDDGTSIAVLVSDLSSPEMLSYSESALCVFRYYRSNW